MSLGSSATEIFAAPVNQKLTDAYCTAFTDLLKSVEEDYEVIATVTGNHFPQTKSLSKFDKVKKPAEVGAALIRMLSDLPSGIIGSPAVFNELYSALYSWRKNREDLQGVDHEPLAKYIAKKIACIPDLLQVHLICAMFGLMHISKRRDADITIMAHVIAPVMLNARVNDVDLRGLEPFSRRKIGCFTETCRRILRVPEKDTVAIKKLGACEYVAGELLRIWDAVREEMMRLEQVETSIALVDTPKQVSDP